MKKTDLFSPLSMLYGAIANARVKLYEKGVFKSYDLKVPTVSVGNITVGGTGKTPLVAFSAKVLAEKGEMVCILTRGYRRESESERVLVSDGREILVNAKKAGDEPFELAQKLLGKSAVIADANRADAGKWARQNLGATAFVLDDAFQHLKVKRHLDIVCIDATNPFGNGKLLPLGVLREPLPNLQRAGAIIITRANLVDEKRLPDLKAEIQKYNQRARIFVSENKIAGVTDLKEFSVQQIHKEENELPIENYKSRQTKNERQRTKDNFLAFCALGNPDAFFEQLRREKFNLVSAVSFPDHHFYNQKDIFELEKAAQTRGAQVLLTTAKDAVKLRDLKFKLPCLVAESRLIFDDEASLRELIVGAGLVPAR